MRWLTARVHVGQRLEPASDTEEPAVAISFATAAEVSSAVCNPAHGGARASSRAAPRIAGAANAISCNFPTRLRKRLHSIALSQIQSSFVLRQVVENVNAQ